MQMTFKERGRYKGFNLDTHEVIYQKSEMLKTSEIMDLWKEYEHQFKNPVNLITKVGAWIHLCALTELLKDKLAWDWQKQRPKTSTHCGQGNPARRSGKSDPDAYMREDYYTNPNYGWCGE